MKFVVKLGGRVMEDPATLRGSTQAIVRTGARWPPGGRGSWRRRGTDAHAGAAGQDRVSLSPGLRITDAETRDAALMVLAGQRE